ncbi:MAG: LURP-one-related family protein [Candidatus Bathyarchaeia archaeon]
MKDCGARKVFSYTYIVVLCELMSGTNSLLGINDLVLKKKILSVREHYDLEDVSGTKLGEADGNLFQFPAKFVVMDTNGSELMHLEGKVLSLRNQFTFYDNARAELGTIKKKIVKLIGEEYWVEKDGREFMRIYGNFTEHDYQMQVNGVQVASVHKKWVSVRDQLGVSMTGEADHRVVIGAVIVIEHVEVTERQRHNQ